MSKSVYEQSIELADKLNTQVGRYNQTLGETNAIDHAMTLLVHELETAVRSVSAAPPYLREAARLADQADDDAQAQTRTQLGEAIRTLDGAREALLKVAAYHKSAQQSASQLMGVVGNESARACSKVVAKVHNTCEALAKKCKDGYEKLAKKLGRHHDAVTLAKTLKEKAETAQQATKLANGEADKAGEAAEKVKAAIDTLELPPVTLAEALIGQLQQASDDLAFLPGPDAAETLAATIKGAIEAPKDITSKKLNSRISKASKAAQDAVNALKAL